ncbi:MAG: lasso peptide biosynthesis B2 protein [Mycobacteriales bacterium]
MASDASLPDERRLGVAAKTALVIRSWTMFLAVRRDLARYPLAEVVTRSMAPVAAPADGAAYHPAQLSRAVGKALGAGGDSVRCIHRALVLQRLLARQSMLTELVIGLKPNAPDHKAHAWVELSGRDIGPAPGRSGHVELARYPVRQR